MAQSFKKNQESLYIRPTNFRFIVVIMVFNKYKILITEGLFYLLKVLEYLLHRFTGLSDLIFGSYAGL